MMTMSSPETYVKRIISFQKATFESSFNFVSMMQEQAERAFQSAIGQVPWMPDEGKLMMEQWVGALQEGRATFQRVVRDGFDQVAETLGRQVAETAHEAARWTGREPRPEEGGRGESGGNEGKPVEAERKPAAPSRKAKACRLNDASKSDLVQLFGIGEATAEKIVSYREANGPYENWEDLEEIPGIRNSIISRLREECSI